MIAFDARNDLLFQMATEELNIEMGSDLERKILLAKLRKTNEQHRNRIHVAHVILQINP